MVIKYIYIYIYIYIKMLRKSNRKQQCVRISRGKMLLYTLIDFNKKLLLYLFSSLGIFN